MLTVPAVHAQSIWVSQSTENEIIFISICYRLNCVTPKCHVPNPQYACVFKEVIRLNEVIREDTTLLGRGEERTESSFSLHLCSKERPGEHLVGRQLSVSQEEGSHQKLNLLAPWPWTSAFWNWKKINSYCLSCPTCSILLWQPWQINTILCIWQK